MKTGRTVGFTGLFIAGAVLVLIFGFLSRSSNRTPSDIAPDRSALQRPETENNHPTNVVGGGMPLETHRTNALLATARSGDISPSACLLLERALAGYNHVDHVRSEMADRGDNVRRVLEALQDELLRDDWALARLHEPRLPKFDDALFQKLLVRTKDSQEPETSIMQFIDESIGSEQSPSSAVSDPLASLREHYLYRIEHGEPGFATVAEILQGALDGKQEYLNSDVLKDAWSFAAVRTTLNQRFEEIEARFNTKESEIDAVSSRISADSIAELKGGAARVAQFMMADIEYLESAYDHVYRWRFEHIHDLDAPGIVDSIGNVSIFNPSPVDLGIPFPQ